MRITPLSAKPRVEGPSLPVVSELLVTARRRPERLDVLPAGVSAVSGEQLLATGAYDVRDTAGQLVGVLSTNLGPGRDKLLMRGLSDGAFTGRARSTVSTYLDDAPINYNAPDPDLRLTDIERVETLRGPQGALYGSGAVAGVYRIVANKPDPERLSAGVQALAATTKGGSATYVVEGFANAPFAEGKGAVRLVGYYDDQGGYIDNVSLRLSNVDSTTRQGGRVAVRFALGDRWTLDVSGAAQRLHSRDTQYVTQTSGAPRAAIIRANQVREASINDFSEAAITLRGAFAGADIAATTSYVQHDFSNLYDATAQASAFSETGASLGIYSEAARIRRVVQDITVTSGGSGAVSWLAGAYGSTSVERTPSALDIQVAATLAGPRLIRVYDEDRRDHLDEIAVYGEGGWRFAPGWTVAAGLRAFQSALHVKSNIVGAFPTQPRFVHETSRFSGLSPKVSLQYEFADGAMVYGLYSEGFRPGGVNSTNFFAVDAARTTFKPDRLQNLELGAKGRFDDGRLVLRAAAFYDLWSNIQSDQYRQNGLAFTANVGDARIQGVEAEASYEWSNGLSIQANALYSDAKITRVNIDLFKNSPEAARRLGSGLPGAPPWSGGVLARYDRPLPHGLTLRLVARANYVGPARLTLDPTLSASTDPVWESSVIGDIVAPHWTAGLYVTNPSDSAGNTFAYGNPFTFGQVRQVTPQRPRTVGLRIVTTF